MSISSDGHGLEHRVGLPLVIGRDPEVLILGTIPSVLSDRKKEYYGNPKNQFWRLIYRVFDDEPSALYEDRLEFLRARRIAMWDVLRECDIDKSKDNSIINPIANELLVLLNENSSIGHIFFNGHKASELFNELVQEGSQSALLKMIKITLPSSSPARAIMQEEKLADWKLIRMALED